MSSTGSKGDDRGHAGQRLELPEAPSRLHARDRLRDGPLLRRSRALRAIKSVARFLRLPAWAFEEDLMDRLRLRLSGRWRGVNRRNLLKVGALSLLPLLLIPAEAQRSADSEYQVKALYLYGFANFVEWPTSAMVGATQPFRICLVGNETVRQELQQVVKGKLVDGHEIQVIRIQRPKDPRLCHILFVTVAAAAQEAPYITLLRRSSVLTVGETPGFCGRGGIMNFWIDSKQVRFEINPKAAERAHLRPSSKLLRLARVVEEPAKAGRSR